MQPDPDDPLTLSKWPFYLGDVLLVASALAIAVLGDWNLSDWQVASCVVAVALGAGLFVLPYVVEYWMRSREVSEDRDAQIRVLRKQLERLGEVHAATASRCEALEDRLASAVRAADVLAPAVDQKLAVADQNLSALSDRLSELQSALDAQKVAWAHKVSDEALEEVRNDVARQNGRIDAIAGLVEDLEKNFKVTGTAVSAESPPSDPPSARPTRRRRDPEARLLRRAISEKEASEASAVSRIIGTKPVGPNTEAPENADADGTEAAPLAATHPPPPAADTETAAPTEDSTPIGTSVPTEASTPAEDSTPPGASVPTEASASTDSKSDADAPRDDAPPEPAEDLFGEPPVSAVRRARPKKNDTVVVVRTLIGIGNKPFIRGGGAGLSWDTGTPMDFEAIGKWSWVAPREWEEPLEVQVFRNDEDPDRKGTYTIEPGQTVEISPVF